MTLRPQRKPVLDAAEEFVDPLKNYAQREYSDDLERSLAEDLPVDVMTTQPAKTVSTDTTVGDVMRMMVDLNIACVLVTDNDRLVGVFSERDVLLKVADQYDKVRDCPISLVMTHEPLVAYADDPVGKALNLMAVAGVRHVPIVDVDGKVVGIVGPRRVIDYLGKHLGQ
ncbi:MAG: CBS domain-containing protein [Phycisphaeraceae bacterium]